MKYTIYFIAGLILLGCQEKKEVVPVKATKTLSEEDSFAIANQFIEDWDEYTTYQLKHNLTGKTILIDGKFIDLYQKDSSYYLVVAEDYDKENITIAVCVIPPYLINKLITYESRYITLGLKISDVTSYYGVRTTDFHEVDDLYEIITGRTRVIKGELVNYMED